VSSRTSRGPLLQRALENAQFAKYAIGDKPEAAALKWMRSYGLRTIVTGIDDRELLHAATSLGSDGFQGCYLCEPESVVSTSLRENKVSVLRLLAAIEDPTNGPVELDAIIRTDAMLSYKVLRCVNSAYFSLPVKVRSVLHATVYLGVNRIRNWIRMIAISGLHKEFRLGRKPVTAIDQRPIGDGTVGATTKRLIEKGRHRAQLLEQRVLICWRQQHVSHDIYLRRVFPSSAVSIRFSATTR